MNDKQQHFTNNQGAPPHTAPIQSIENRSTNQQPPNQSGNAYDSNQNYYQQYYSGYYANATDHSYYQNNQQSGYYYPQNFQNQGASIPQGGYQPGHDYSSMYNQPSYDYSHKDVSTYPNYSIPSSHVISAQHSEKFGAAAPSYTTQNQVQIKREPRHSEMTGNYGPSDITQNQVHIKQNSEKPIITTSDVASVNTLEQVPTKKENPQPKVAGASTPVCTNIEQAHVKQEYEQSFTPQLKVSKPTVFSELVRSAPTQPQNFVPGTNSSTEASRPVRSKDNYNESRQFSRTVASKSVPVDSELAHSGGTNFLTTRTVFNTDKAFSENSASATRFNRNLPSFESREKSAILFPPSLRTFLTRIYKEFPLSKDNPDCENELIRLVVEAATSGKLFSCNWETHSVPSIIKELSCAPVPGKNPVVKKKTKAKKDTAPKTSDSDSDMDEMAKAMQNSHFERIEAADDEILNDRIKRFKPINKEDSFFRIEVEPPSEQIRPDVIDWDDSTIVGTCRKHEKSYFRLTSKVNPALVRPLRILEEWYDKLMVLWNKKKDYGYFLDQFQAIRQDLTVQRIKNPFAVRTYETVARVALEKGDLGEFNKCQTTLIELYSHGIRGNECEFIAYRLLYYMHTRSQSDINQTLSTLSKRHKSDVAISHALELFFAYNSLNYFRFFKLVKVTPNLGRHLIDHFLERERIRALITICTGFRQTINVDYVFSSLGFDTIQDCLDLLKVCNIVPVPISSEEKTSISCLQFSTRPVVPLVEAAYNKFNKIDLKGQIN